MQKRQPYFTALFPDDGTTENSYHIACIYYCHVSLLCTCHDSNWGPSYINFVIVTNI